MALQDIIDRIKSDAEAEIARMKKEADSVVHGITEDCDKECEQILDNGRKEGDRIAAENRNSMIIETNLANRKELLGGRMQLINKVFASVGEKLHADKEKYRTFLISSIVKGATIGDEKVIFSQRDRTELKDEINAIVQEANERLLENHLKGELVLTNDIGDFDGGVVLRRGRASTILTIETVLTDLRDSFESDVAGILAGDNV